MSMTLEEKRARKAERDRQYRETNKEKVAERNRRYREANKEKEAEQKRRHYEANKEKLLERQRQYQQANKEKVTDRMRQYREANKEELAERKRQYSEANKEKVTERKRRHHRRKGFSREDGSSFQSWQASLYNRSAVFAAIANLTPDPGQTLAELIHELSGYAMEVCELIADPPVAEETPELTPPPEPDLF